MPGPDDYASFLAHQLPPQPSAIARYQLGGEQVWLKRAGPDNGMWHYHCLLGRLAALLHLPVLRPVPNHGGRAAIATDGAASAPAGGPGAAHAPGARRPGRTPRRSPTRCWLPCPMGRSPCWRCGAWALLG